MNILFKINDKYFIFRYAYFKIIKSRKFTNYLFKNTTEWQGSCSWVDPQEGPGAMLQFVYGRKCLN